MGTVVPLPETAITIGASATDWRDAIRWAGRVLIASGTITNQYTDEMIATVESLGPYIVIAPGIALAHSRPSPAVLHAGFSVVTLKRPVEFGPAQSGPPIALVVDQPNRALAALECLRARPRPALAATSAAARPSQRRSRWRAPERSR